MGANMAVESMMANITQETDFASPRAGGACRMHSRMIDDREEALSELEAAGGIEQGK